jgi:hypothetical protein
MGFHISHPKIELELQLYEVDKLHIHEEIIQESVEKLIKAFKEDQYAKHPILVDKATLVILDGMHRTWAFKHLGYKLIPVCLMEYNNPNIIVKSWFRTIQHEQKTWKDLLTDLKELGYIIQDVKEEELQSKIRNQEALIGIVTSENSYGVLGKPRNIKNTYEYIKQLEETLREIGYQIGYETREDALWKAKDGTILAAVTAPEITKQDIVEVALAGQVFVHKATRHVIPARPLFVNVPFKWMNLEPEEANKLLVESLSKKKMRRLPPGQTLDRRYEEELYVFE